MASVQQRTHCFSQVYFQPARLKTFFAPVVSLQIPNQKQNAVEPTRASKELNQSMRAL